MFNLLFFPENTTVLFKHAVFYIWQPELQEKQRRKQNEGRNVRQGKLIQMEIKNSRVNKGKFIPQYSENNLLGMI